MYADSIRALMPDDAAPVLGIGELLWDLFPDGRRLGGAPFNVIAGLRRLGHPAAFLTAVGDDEPGRAAIAEVVALDVDPAFIGVSGALPTGSVAVVPDPRTGHRFEIGSPAAYDALTEVDDAGRRIAGWSPRAVVFGTLAQRSVGNRALTRTVAMAGPTERLFDLNLRDGCWTPGLVLDLLPLATIVKANDTEAAALATILDVGPAPATLGEALAGRFGIRLMCITRGSGGATLWRDGEVWSADGVPIAVADTVGAGDAFAAGLLHGVLAGLPAPGMLAFANRLGALVASRPGALPAWRIDEVLGAPDDGGTIA
jgi:fructokinase